jgi:hypothetical protein
MARGATNQEIGQALEISHEITSLTSWARETGPTQRLFQTMQPFPEITSQPKESKKSDS